MSNIKKSILLCAMKNISMYIKTIIKRAGVKFVIIYFIPKKVDVKHLDKDSLIPPILLTIVPLPLPFRH